MLRGLVVLLAGANLLFWLGSQFGLAERLGAGGASAREPTRLARQVRPQAVQVLPPGSVPASAPLPMPMPLLPSAPTGAGPTAGAAPGIGRTDGARPGISPTANAALGIGPAASAALADALATAACVEAGPYNDAQMAAAARDLQQAGLPTGAWMEMRRDQQAAWVIYMGRYTAADLQRKRDELRRRGVAFQDFHGLAALEPGLSLGRFGSPAEAQSRLSALEQSGVHTARVVQSQAAGIEHRLRIDRLDEAARQKLRALKSTVLPARWASCGPAAG